MESSPNNETGPILQTCVSGGKWAVCGKMWIVFARHEEQIPNFARDDNE